MAPPTQQSSQATPLPLAAGRAALSNRISLLLAGQSSILKTMSSSPRKAPPTSRSQATAAAAAETDQEANFKSLGRDNEGVGYVDPNKTTQDTGASKRDQILRNKLLGKRKANGQSVAAAVAVEEEDDDEGRSGLGKRKRPRRQHVQVDVTVEEGQSDQTPAEEVPEGGKDEQEEDGTAEEAAAETLAPETTPQDDANKAAESEAKKKKKKKKRKKNKIPNGNTEIS